MPNLDTIFSMLSVVSITPFGVSASTDLLMYMYTIVHSLRQLML